MTRGASRQANCEEQHEAVGPIERQAGSGQQRCVYYWPWASSGAGVGPASGLELGTFKLVDERPTTEPTLLCDF